MTHFSNRHKLSFHYLNNLPMFENVTRYLDLRSGLSQIFKLDVKT